MKIYIDKDISNLSDLMAEGTVIDIQDIQDRAIEELLEIEQLIIVAAGEDNSELVFQMINTRPNEKKKITLVQTHPNLIVLLDKQGAKLIL